MNLQWRPLLYTATPLCLVMSLGLNAVVAWPIEHRAPTQPPSASTSLKPFVDHTGRRGSTYYVTPQDYNRLSTTQSFVLFSVALMLAAVIANLTDPKR